MKQLLMTMALSTIAATNLPAHPAAIDALLARMSLDEKIGQMVQLDLMTVTVRNSSPIQLGEQRLRRGRAWGRLPHQQRSGPRAFRGRMALCQQNHPGHDSGRDAEQDSPALRH